MAKRKPAVNDIIYELDNDDSEISEDEVTQPKIQCLEETTSSTTTQSDSNTQSSCLEVIDLNGSTEKMLENGSPRSSDNGGKTLDEFIILDEVSNTASPKSEVDKFRKVNSETIFNEDIIIDSPASNSDPGVVGCENRTPLVTVKFRDNKLAMNYKKKIKEFMLSLIKLHENNGEVDGDTDLELDIWPEDLAESNETNTDNPEDNLFFVDTDPSMDMREEIPRYSQNLSMISNASEKEPSPPPMFRKGPICFNCEGSHALRDCTLPRNNIRIAERRKAVQKLGRYHVEDEQKYGHLIAGRISGELRHALGLKRHELPLHIYRMRLLGYPPGWMEEARISHSGITLFDSSGQATLDPEEEEGEVCEPGCKDKYDIKKILDFPGFNVPASSRYKEESHKLGLPPLSAQDSKLSMLQLLAPNAMKAYKRKKLTFFPSAPDAAPAAGPAEMDIDSGDEVAEFPSQPPLPDDAPPPPPPPPETPPPPPETPPPPPKTPPEQATSPKVKPPLPDTQLPKEPSPKAMSSPLEKIKASDKMESDDDLEVVKVIKVAEIPVPMADLITIDVDGDVSNTNIDLMSPSLDDLEKRKKLLLDALENDGSVVEVIDNTTTDDVPLETSTTDSQKVTEDLQDTNEKSQSIEAEIQDTKTQTNEVIEEDQMKEVDSKEKTSVAENRTGQVRLTNYGTPILNTASPYSKLPSEEKFAKDICDIINFENLPNSTGKYKKISTLLKKVKSEVDRIQES